MTINLKETKDEDEIYEIKNNQSLIVFFQSDSNLKLITTVIMIMVITELIYALLTYTA